MRSLTDLRRESTISPSVVMSFGVTTACEHWQCEALRRRRDLQRRVNVMRCP